TLAISRPTDGFSASTNVLLILLLPSLYKFTSLNYNAVTNAPSINNACPVTYVFAPEAKKTTVLANSLGKPSRPIGISFAILFITSSVVLFVFPAVDSPNCNVRSVSILPGPTVLTNILSLANSLARLLVNPCTPGLITFERIKLSILALIDDDVIFIIRPLLSFFISGITSLVILTTLNKFCSNA